MTAKTLFRLGDITESDAYKLMSGLIVPRPIGWIGTWRPDGTDNLAPFSFFNMVSSKPPAVMFSAGRRSSGDLKDTASFAEESGEFTVNIVSEDVAEVMNATALSFPADVNEFEECGLTAVRGSVVSAPMVAEAPANLECRVIHAFDLGDSDGGSRVVFGEVVAVHVREDILDGVRIDHEALRAVGRLAGNAYSTTRDRFELTRPTQ